jgi:hypothetical protein
MTSGGSKDKVTKDDTVSPITALLLAQMTAGDVEARDAPDEFLGPRPRGSEGAAAWVDHLRELTSTSAAC